MSDPEPGKEATKEESPHMISALMAENAAVAETPAGLTEASPVETAGAVQIHKKTFTVIGAVVVIIAAVMGAYIILTMPTAMNGDTVAIYYNESFENGTVYLSAMNTTYPPLVFIIGNSSVISGVQDAVIGMSPGETKTVIIPYTQAYGAYDPGLVQTLNRTGPIANASFTAGEYYSIHYKTTDTYSTVKILKVSPTTITWDANNPLAGYNLTFTIQLANLTRASTAAATA